jgi:hypothetical protein
MEGLPMSDIPNRAQLEAQLARVLGRLLRAQMGKLLELMGDPPRIENVPPEFWEEQGAEFDQSIRPFLQRLFQDQAARLVSETPLGVDWALINDRAVSWARSYTYDLVRGINTTSRQTLQRALSSYYTDGMTIGDLENMISGTFGPVRSEMISITEITRASSRGEDALWEELHNNGIDMITFWNTNADELVCDICSPLDGREADGRENGEPYWIHPDSSEKVTMPAHVRCRCFESNELPRANGKNN